MKRAHTRVRPYEMRNAREHDDLFMVCPDLGIVIKKGAHGRYIFP